MAQWPRSLVALIEDLDPIPNTTLGSSKPSIIRVPKDPVPPSDLPSPGIIKA